MQPHNNCACRHPKYYGGIVVSPRIVGPHGSDQCDEIQPQIRKILPNGVIFHEHNGDLFFSLIEEWDVEIFIAQRARQHDEGGEAAEVAQQRSK